MYWVFNMTYIRKLLLQRTSQRSPSALDRIKVRRMFNEDLNNVLMELVQKDKITMGVNEEGEFVFWMTDEQKAVYFEENGEENGHE
jgi:hypothetical protein